MGEIIFLVVVAVVAVIMFFMANSFPTSIIDSSGGSSLFPKIMAVILLFFIIIKVITILKDKEKRNKKFNFLEIFKGIRFIYLITTIAYFALVTIVGFVLSSIIYLVGTMIYFAYYKEGKLPSKKSMAITASIVVVSVVALDFLFCRTMGIMLPVGLIGF